jgi:copper homeostasis protein
MEPDSASRSPSPSPEEEDRLRPELLNLEVAVFSGNEALLAQNLGATRVELNAPGSYEDGGLTPPVSELTSVYKRLDIPVRIMIRPRGPPADGSPDFIYSAAEFGQMIKAVEDFKEVSLMNPIRGDGFVFGIMMKADEESLEKYPDEKVAIDKVRCAQLLHHARPFGCIFHRAFDPIAASPRWSEGLDQLVALRFAGVLTAGGLGNAADNIPRSEQICKYSKDRIEIVVGGGLRQENVEAVASRLACHPECTIWLHTAAAHLVFGDHIHQGPLRRWELDDKELIDMLRKLSLAKPD